MRLLNDNNLFLIKSTLFLMFLTSSFDIFLNFRVGGFSLRLFYILEFFCCLAMYLTALKLRSFKVKFLYGEWLLIWFLFIVVFIPNTTILLRSVGYAIWLMLSMMVIIIISTLVHNKSVFDSVLKLYIISFVFVALFGLLQFSLGLIGIDVLVTQWWIPGVLPRINGFSYEPSFFGTYLLAGWLITFYMFMKGEKQFLLALWLLSFVILISSSRMSIIVMVLAACSLILKSIVRDLLLFRLTFRNIYVLAFFFLLTISLVIFFIDHWESLKFLLSGLGVAGGADHSSSTRINEMFDTLQVFLDSPIVGVSLGGVASAIAQVRGVNISSQLEAKSFEGMNVIVEVLAASGIFGFFFFVLFFFLLFRQGYRVSKKIKYIDPSLSLRINALCFALIFEIVLLSMNQNILRIYLWVLIGLLSSAILIGRRLLVEISR